MKIEGEAYTEHLAHSGHLIKGVCAVALILLCPFGVGACLHILEISGALPYQQTRVFPDHLIVQVFVLELREH